MQPVAATVSISVFLEGLAYALQHSIFLRPYGEVLSIWNWLGVLVPIQRVLPASAKFLTPSRVVSVPCEQILRRTAAVGHHHPFEGAVSLFKEALHLDRRHVAFFSSSRLWALLERVDRNHFCEETL